jgi:heterodisulfide reductase subunit D
MPAIAELRRSSGTMRCLECGKCSTLCPLSKFGSFSVARMAAIHDPATGVPPVARSVDRCLTCGACELRCPQGVRFTEFVLGLRERVPSTQRSPCPHGGVMTAAARLSAASGVRRDLRWIGDGLRVAESGETALFVGCLPLFDSVFEDEFGIHLIEIARAAIRLLNAAGVEPVIVADERCCGHDSLWNGDRATFAALAAANAETFAARGVKRIVTACAECCRTWRLDYAEAVPSYRPEVEHISEFVARSIGSGAMALGNGASPRITFHDPCRLGRHLGVVDAPRQVLASISGAEFVEMEEHGADAQCCGTSGFIHCDGDSRKMQESRLRSAAATGAEVMLTACPKCLIHFSCSRCEERLRGREGPQVEIDDFARFAAAHIALPAEIRLPSKGEGHDL